MPKRIEIVESVPEECELGIADTRRTRDVWLEMVDAARETLDIETFYIVGRERSEFVEIVEAIKSAARRGVRVRILTDARMTGVYPRTVAELAAVENVEARAVKVFNERSGVLHAKYFVVDGEALFVGSQNFDWRALTHIHELGVRITDEALAARFRSVFEFDWRLAGGRARRAGRPRRGRAPARPLVVRESDGRSVGITPAASPIGLLPDGAPSEEAELVRLLDGAKERIDVQLLLYSPRVPNDYYGTIDNALRRAAARGVTVRMIVSNWNLRDPDLRFLKGLCLVPGVRIGISSLPEHSSGFIPFARVEHCKYVTVDGTRSWIATGNWSYDYFHCSRNLALVIDDRTIAELLARVFERSWNSRFVELLDPCRDYAPPRIEGPEQP